MKRCEVDREKLSPMMRQYLEIKDAYEDSIIFFRLGDFYEMFFEDAVTAAHELELTLTGKQAGLEERVPMCGIPYKAYQAYLDKLVEKGYKVAIVEQMEDPKQTKDMVKREVIQVVTKGTRLDSSIDAKSNQFVASLYDFEYCYVLTFADISTGKIYVMLLSHQEEHVLRSITRYQFLEIIASTKVSRTLINTLRTVYHISVSIQDEIEEDKSYQYLYQALDDVRLMTGVKHLLYYFTSTKKGDLHHLQPAIVEQEKEHLLLDNHTKQNLELTKTLRTQERVYSLLWLLDKNKTAMGSRLLKQSIESPLTNIKELQRRYDFVSKLQVEFILRDDLKKSLSEVYDLERLAGRICYGNLNARDMLQLKNSLKALPTLAKILEDLHYDKKIETFDELYALLEQSICEDAPLSLKEGHLIKYGYDKTLDELQDISTGSKDFLLELESKEKERTGIKTLKVGFNKVFGYYIEISKGQVPLLKDEFGYIRKQTLSNCERFITQELKEKENIILGAEEKIIQLEYQIFMKIREITKRYITRLQQVSLVIAEVDMLQSFSTVADLYHYVRPNLTDKNEIKLLEARHPVVEQVMSLANKKYVSNDIIMDEDTSILLITGPNMAGKSTYMRQLAIIVIMAQIGCFVPCKKATLPIFDKIFTRIGASDDLVSGESTFMVEMKEANLALCEATSHSLILFDELGRGTATYDGMSLAQAILEYIHDKIGAKTLFSTHYHELVSLSSSLSHLRNVHVSAIEEAGKLTFLHKVKPGSIDKSYGLNVASLAHLPTSLIQRAKEILEVYEHTNFKKPTFTQTTLFVEEEEKEVKQTSVVEEKLKECDPLQLTPIEALNFLYELKEEMNRKSD